MSRSAGASSHRLPAGRSGCASGSLHIVTSRRIYQDDTTIAARSSLRKISPYWDSERNAPRQGPEIKLG